MKKETYFSFATIDVKAREMIASAESFRHSREPFQIERVALLVLDMQSYFLDESSHAFIPSAAAIIPKIENLIRTFSACRRPIIYTRHTNTPVNAGQMARWWKDLLAPNSALSQIVSDLDTSSGIVIEKHQYDAFYQTDLEQLLRDRNIGQVLITGVMTHLCCETTARSAFTRGFGVFFTVDGTATYTEAFHRASVLNLAHGFSMPVLTDEIMAVFRWI